MAASYSREEIARHDSADDAWVIVDGQVYDISPFLGTHPGGIGVTEDYLGTDISAVIRSEDVHKHTRTAFEVMEKYCIGVLEDSNCKTRKALQTSQKAWNEDELIDWSQALLPQVAQVGHHYKEWVHSPVHRPLRLFESDIIESLTKSPWWLVPLVWIPIVIYICHMACINAPTYIPTLPPSLPLSIIQLLALLAVGVLLWTLIEYSLHRFVFHLDPPPDSKFWITFHFVIHGQHHKVPFDTMRLVFPPVPAGIIAMILYLPFAHLLPLNVGRAVLAGALLGYIGYDLTHYYLHHGSPTPGSYFASLKTYHVAHHYINYNQGFGISSKLWDIPFGTLLKLNNKESVELDNKMT